jgi:hypothetical protein
VNIQDKLQVMLIEHVWGAIQLKDGTEFIATVEEISNGQVVFLDHSPDISTPVIEAACDTIAQIHIPDSPCSP